MVGDDVVDGRYESPRESFGGGILLKKHAVINPIAHTRMYKRDSPCLRPTPGLRRL